MKLHALTLLSSLPQSMRSYCISQKEPPERGEEGRGGEGREGRGGEGSIHPATLNLYWLVHVNSMK